MLIEQRLAVESLAAVLAGRSLSVTLERVFKRHPELETAQRAAIFDVAHGTLRELGLLRAVLNRLLRKPLEPVAMESLLLVALYQLAFTKAAPYAVVDHAVEATRASGWPRAGGLVNAVLRRFLREREGLLAGARERPEGRYSYPLWWLRRVQSQYPLAWERILAAGNERAPMFLRVNRRRTCVASYLARLRAAGVAADAIGESVVVLGRPLPVLRLPGFAEGCISVQDAGAQLAADMLDLRPGQRVLDAFAAPGGKSAHILEREDVELIALDNDANRLERLNGNLQRLGLKASVICADAADARAWWDGRAFDRVLADLPCTASGVVRRHPDIKWLRRESDIAALAARASGLLDSLWRLVRPGGKLLLATCSIFQEENRAQVDDFVGRHADARPAPLPGQDGFDVQLLPDERHDGFYYALLERI